MTQCKCGIGKPHGEDGLPYDLKLPHDKDCVCADCLAQLCGSDVPILEGKK